MDRSTRALTLVELLVALAILVTVGSSTVLIFRGVTRAWQAGELGTERYQQARLLFDLLGRELSSAVASPRYPLVGLSGAGGEHLREDSVSDELFFAGRLSGRTGIVERGYWVTAEGRLFCHDDVSGDGDYATGERELCGRDVGELDMAYFDGAAWRDGWDARDGAPEAGALPKAVRIVMTIGRRAPERFETIVSIPTS